MSNDNLPPGIKVEVKATRSAPQEVAEQTTTEVTDSLGRKLVIRQLSILDESRIVRECGAHASNQNYMLGYVIPAALIESIDGERCSVPTTAGTIDFAIQRARREGLAAVMADLERRAKERANGGDSEIKK